MGQDGTEDGGDRRGDKNGIDNTIDGGTFLKGRVRLILASS